MTTQPPDETPPDPTPSTNATDSPRDFVVGTGFVFLCVGGVFLFSVCCVWSYTTYFNPPATHAGGHWMDNLSAALLTIGAAATLAGGVGLCGVGIGLQGERPSSGIAAVIVTGLLGLTFWVICGLYCFRTDSWSGRITALLFAGVTTSLFALAIRSAMILRRFPPPADQNVVTEEFLEAYRTRKRSRH